MNRRAGRWAGVALATMALLAAVGCTDERDARPTPSTRATTSTVAVDRSGVALAGVPGQTTSTIKETGTTTLTGSVRGPDGLIPGATVRVERLVGGNEVRSDVVTGADGRFSLAGVPGGRYRLRAFLAPSLVQLQPEVRFLADGDEYDFDLVVEEAGGLIVRSDVAPSPPLRGKPVNLVVLVLTRSVSDDGVVTSTPVVGLPVQLDGLGRWTLREEEPDPTTTTSFGVVTSTTEASASSAGAGRTDPSGRVRFEMLCRTTGEAGLSLLVPVRQAAAPPSPNGDPATTPPAATPVTTTERIAIDVPACVDPASATTSSTQPGASSGGGSPSAPSTTP